MSATAEFEARVSTGVMDCCSAGRDANWDEMLGRWKRPSANCLVGNFFFLGGGMSEQTTGEEMFGECLVAFRVCRDPMQVQSLNA